MGDAQELGWRRIGGVVAGNALEFYDFVTYTFFAAQIGRTLFPSAGGHGLMLSLATFGAGFLTRPLGGFVLGRYADRRGRRPAMMLCFALMGVAIVGLALTPSYAAIGMAAPLMVVGFRLLQGFALGGEVGPNTAYLLEAAPPHRRGFYVSFQYATQDVAVLAAGAVGLVVSAWLSPAQVDAYGWRIAFLLGAAIIPFGLAVRRRLVETLPASQPSADREPFPVRIAVAGLLILGAGTIGNYTLNYLTTYAQTTLGMPVHAAFGATAALGLGSAVADIVAGLLTDRYGRKRVVVAPWLGLAAAAVPAFLLMNAFRTSEALLAATLVLSLLLGFAITPGITLLTEALPARVRAGALGLIYAVAIASFGGSAQLVETALIRWTGSPLAPAWYMAGALAIGFAGILLVPEHRPARRPADTLETELLAVA